MSTNRKDAHEPGPWTLKEWQGSDHAWSIDSPDHKGFIIIYDLADVNNEANAKLVAAAPETAAERDRLKETGEEVMSLINDDILIRNTSFDHDKGWTVLTAKIANVLSNFRAALGQGGKEK